MRMRSERGRVRVLEAATQVFQREGFQTATMARVAEAAGVSKGLPYHYFESKEALARAVVAAHLDGVVQVLSRWPSAPPDEQLRWFLKSALDHARTYQDSFRLYLSLALHPGTRELVLAEVERRQALLDGVEGELRSIFVALGHPVPEIEALVLRATVDGLIQYLLMAPDRFPADEAVSRLLALHGQRSKETG